MDVHDGPTLLAGIIANPDDDTRRRVFADWLQEQDDPEMIWLGTFIAAQLAGRPVENLRYRDKVIGIPALSFADYGISLHPCPRVFAPFVTYWKYTTYGDARVALRRPRFDVNRGFVCGAEMFCSDFLETAGALFARHPIDHVEIPNRRPIRIQADDDGEIVDWSFNVGDYGGWESEHDFWKLPPALFDFLADFDASRNETLGPGLGTDVVKIYTSEETAAAALRAGALAFGRSEAVRWLAHNSP